MAKHLSRLKMWWNALFRAPKVNIFPREVPSLIQWNGDSPLHTSPRMRTRFELIYFRQPNVFSFFFKFSGEPWKTAKRLSGRVLNPIGKVAARKVHLNYHNLSENLVTISNVDLQFMTNFWIDFTLKSLKVLSTFRTIRKSPRWVWKIVISCLCYWNPEVCSS